MKIFDKEKPVPRARKIMRKSFIDDPDFEWTYICNIAMLLYDKHGGVFEDYDTRNETAKEILDLIFGR